MTVRKRIERLASSSRDAVAFERVRQLAVGMDGVVLVS